MSEVNIILAKIILDYHQFKYVYRSFILSNRYLIKDILLISLKIGDRNVQLRNYQKITKSIFLTKKSEFIVNGLLNKYL